MRRPSAKTAAMSFSNALSARETSRPPAASHFRESPAFHDRRRLGGRRGSSLRHRTADTSGSSGRQRCVYGGARGAHPNVPDGNQQWHDRAAVPGPVGLGGARWYRAVLARTGCHRQIRAANQCQRRLPGSPASARDICCHLAGPCGPQQRHRRRLPARPAVLRGRATVMAGRRVRHGATFLSRLRGRSCVTTLTVSMALARHAAARPGIRAAPCGSCRTSARGAAPIAAPASGPVRRPGGRAAHNLRGA